MNYPYKMLKPPSIFQGEARIILATYFADPKNKSAEPLLKMYSNFKLARAEC